MNNEVIDAGMAQNLQNKAILENDLWIWAVYQNPEEFPGKFIARPWSTKLHGSFGFVLVGDTLKALRAQLPWGLTWMERDEDDEPGVVETWL